MELKEVELKEGTILTVTRLENGKMAIESKLTPDEALKLYKYFTEGFYRVCTEGCGYNHEEAMTIITEIVLQVSKEKAAELKREE